MTREIKTLREQARKLTSQLKSTLGDASKRDQALKEARAKVAELKLELGRKTADLRRKSGELTHRSGTYEGTAKHKWHTAGFVQLSDGRRIATEGDIDLVDVTTARYSDSLHLYALISKGAIPHIRLGSSIRVPTEAL
jgi:hypothetical protein